MPPPERPRPQDAPQRPQEPRQGDPDPKDEPSNAPSAPKAPAASQEPEKRWDETVPGGKYEVGGRLVDADGKPIDRKKPD